MVKPKKALKKALKKKGFSDFRIKVYTAAAEIPPGRVRSYKWIARRIGNHNASRAVGGALKKNPYPADIPCHRVVRSDGSIGGFARGKTTKMRLLKAEGVAIIGSKIRR